MMPKGPIDVLYIEDDPADADFAQVMIEEVGCKRMKLRVVADGQTAAQSLGIEPSENRVPPRIPQMILLDLNIPRIHGKELLRRIKSSDWLKFIPVVILSTSDYQADINDTYRLGAAGFFTKASSYEESKSIFRTICDYWSHNAKLPEVHHLSPN